MPHGVGVVRVAVAEVLRVESLEIKKPHLRRGAAPISLPCSKTAVLWRVGDAIALGVEGAELAVRHGQAFRKPTPDRHRPQLIVAGHAAGALRGKEQSAAVGTPVDETIIARVIGDSVRSSTHRGNHIDIGVAVVVGTERDPGAVGRELRKLFLTCRGAETVGGAAVLAHQPDVTGIDKRDVGVGHIRVAQ